MIRQGTNHARQICNVSLRSRPLTIFMTPKLSKKAKHSTRKVTTHTPEGAAVTELILTIFRTNGRIVQAGDDLLRDLNLTGSRWQVLGAVKQVPRTVAQIARQFELSRQRVLWHVQALIESGIVELVRNPDHRRAKLVTLTEQGRRVYDEIERRQNPWVNGFGKAFRLDDLLSATECVRRLGELMKGNDDDSL